MSIAERVRVHEVQTLSDDWHVLTKTRFSFRRSNGEWQEQWRESYDRGNGATLLLYDLQRRTVILTNQFRYSAFVNGHDALLMEAPAGLLDKARPEDRIRSEVQEETGFRVGEVQHVFDVFMSPGSVTERLHFFVAPYDPSSRIGSGGGNRDEGEDIEVLELTIDDALAMIGRGDICDGKTIILLQHAALNIFETAPAGSLPCSS